jgi:hypothetical protein
MTADRRQGTFGLPVDLAGSQALTDETWRFALSGFAMVCAVTLAVVAGGILYTTDTADGTWEPFGDTGPALPYVFAPVVVLVLIALARLPGQLSKGRELGDRWLAPLGLHIEAMPQSVILPDATGDPHHHLVGPSRYVGVRHGRRVRVDVTAGGSTLLLEGGFATPFEVTGKDGVLTVVRGEDWVRSAVAGVGANDAWRKITITGGPAGIAVERRGRGDLGRGWLADLWLAEQLQHQKGPGPVS